MQPARESNETTVCLRDNAPVRGDAPRCRYPTSWCQFREFCCIRAAAKKPGGRTGDEDD